MNQYIRKFTLLIGNASSALDFSELRTTFTVKKSDAQTPNSALIKIYNVSADTAQKVIGEFTAVIMQAGYVDNFGVIFQGTVKLASFSRENGTETVLTVYAGDGDIGYNTAIINKTLAAGADQNVIAAEATKTLSGVTQGYTPNFNSEKLPRGKVMFGMSRGVLRNVAKTTKTTWSIQDGALQFVELTGYLPGQAVVLNSESGLIGAAEQTTEGVKVRCLINPFLKVGGLIKLNNEDILRAAPVEEPAKKEGESKKEDVKKNSPLNLDGVYRILVVEFDGDSQGQNWYADLLCLSVDESAKASKKVQKT